MRRFARRLARALGGDGGYAAAELALGLGLLVLPVALLVLVLPTWFERQSMARLAAQEASRVVVLSDNLADGYRAGEAIAGQIAANHQINPDSVHVEFPEASLARGGSVQARVSVKVPLILLPGIGQVGSFEWSVTHTENVDRYRSFR